MNIKERQGTVILELKGKLVGGSLNSRMDKTLSNFMEQGKKNIVFDLSSVTHINSSGMGMLISGYSKVKDNGGALKLANLTSKMQSLLSITRLNRIIETYNSVDEAVQSFT
jgi:anti-sigma B factor antagonist